MICNNCKDDVNEYNNFILLGCKHNYCFKCLQSYISENVAISIKCPFNKCQTKICDKIIRECLPNSELILYDRSLVLNASKNFVKCLTGNCPYIVYMEDNVTNFSCTYCKQPNCMKCKKRHTEKCNQKDHDEAEITRAADNAMSEHIRHDLEEYFNSSSYIPNPEPFECILCLNYILPRKGLTLRNCHHCFCQPCFKTNFDKAELKIQDFHCPICCVEINEIEIINVIGKPKFNDLILRSARYKLFQCKYPDCKGSWDPNGFKGCFTCPVCKRTNCHECEDIHEKMSCDSFKKTPRYINQQKRQESSIKCYYCNYPIIKLGGCGALLCICNRNICQYTGKAAGNNGPDSCGCTDKKRCDPKCQFGCFPER